MRLSSCVFSSLLLLFLSYTGFSQSRSSQLDKLYQYVEQADSLAIKSQKTFYLEKFLKDDHVYRETWRYSANEDKVVFFQVDYMLDSMEFTEVYYINRGRLVCSEEYEKINYSSMEDRLNFGSILYFESAVPRHVVMLGRQRYDWKMSDPGYAALTRFSKRYSELKRHIPMLPY